ncbi:MAG: hypothetical protein WCI27_01270 [Candidatus Omnitrophota bacterium]
MLFCNILIDHKKGAIQILTHVFLLFFLVACASCGGGGSAVSLHNDEINAELKTAIQSLTRKITESIKNNDSSVLLDLFTDEVRNQAGIDVNLKNAFQQLNHLFKDATFKTDDEYSITVNSWGKFHPVISSETQEPFSLTLDGKGNKVYVSLLSAKNDFKDFMLVLVFINIKDEWRVSSFNFGVYKIAGKSAVNWANEARQLFDQGYFVPAILRLQVLQECLRPAPFIQYAKEGEILALRNKIQGDIVQKYKFPVRITNVVTVPEIYFVAPQFVRNELWPLVKYKTSLSLSDTVALKKEVDAMTPELELLFPGITKESKGIAYQAFSEAPADPKKQYQYYGLVVDLN